ncbi:MAG: diacylglycerol kinase family lipid kinase [Oscillospiraceae bacterium]|nr:diacylglycerol kinase family lipid kinase [Oscillospiraceae bacterium]
MKHLFIINPAAGKYDHAAELRPVIRAAMTGRGLDYAVEITSGPRHAEQLVRQYAAEGTLLRVYACGGDGTLNEVASGAAGCSHVAVTQLPLGSGNDFIKLFGAGRSRFSSLDELLDPEVSAMDMIRCNDRWCMNICSLGLDARIGTSIARYRRLPLVTGAGAYLISTVVCVVQDVHQHFVLELDGQKRFDQRFTMVCICNGRWYGGSFNPVPTALPDDGLLDVLAVAPVSRLTVATVIGKYAKGRYAEYPELIAHYRCRSLRLTADRPTDVNLDGELILTEQAEIRLVPKCLNFFYPKGLSWQPAENI